MISLSITEIALAFSTTEVSMLKILGIATDWFLDWFKLRIALAHVPSRHLPAQS